MLTGVPGACLHAEHEEQLTHALCTERLTGPQVLVRSCHTSCVTHLRDASLSCVHPWCCGCCTHCRSCTHCRCVWPPTLIKFAPPCLLNPLADPPGTPSAPPSAPQGVRTSDDASLTVKVMVFYSLVDIEALLSNSHDPIGDFINAL